MTYCCRHPGCRPEGDEDQTGRNDRGSARAGGRLEWLPYVAPLAVYLACGLAEPVGDAATGWSYPTFYVVRWFATLVAAVAALPAYRRFPGRPTWLAPLVGLGGGILWTGLCGLELEARLLESLGRADWMAAAARASFNPLEYFRGRPLTLAGFLAIRFAGLVLLVPLIEEFFLRGFLIRFLASEHWPQLGLQDVGRQAYAVAMAYGVLTHPGEALAAAAWFALVTWLMLRTGRIWDCVVAHAVTNLVLGLYVLGTGNWSLW